jgi:hypothetical protein
MWQWEAFAPAEPSAMGRLFGGAGRYERAVADAQRRYGKALAERAAAERERLGPLEAAEQAYAQRRAAEQEAVDRHNAEVDRLKQRLDAGDPDAVVECFRRVLRRSAYPDGFPRSYRVAYQAEARQLVVEYQLPGREIIPTQARFNYNKSLDLVEAKPRAPKEIAKLYESVVSQIALRTLREVFAVQADGVVDTVVFNGHVSTKDPATGQPRYPCIVSVAATREQFSGLVLTDVTPREPLRHLNVLVSPHPFDLEAVRPVLEFDLTKYKFVDEIDMIAGLDGRLDLLELTPTEFEHLVRQLFEEIGMQAWVTQASRDDGVDAVAINPDPIVGGLCIVQAKRYTGVVSTESVRALGGVMDDKRAAKGLMVTTSWYGQGELGVRRSPRPHRANRRSTAQASAQGASRAGRSDQPATTSRQDHLAEPLHCTGRRSLGRALGCARRGSSVVAEPLASESRLPQPLRAVFDGVSGWSSAGRWLPGFPTRGWFLLGDTGQHGGQRPLGLVDPRPQQPPVAPGRQGFVLGVHGGDQLLEQVADLSGPVASLVVGGTLGQQVPAAHELDQLGSQWRPRQGPLPGILRGQDGRQPGAGGGTSVLL